MIYATGMRLLAALVVWTLLLLVGQGMAQEAAKKGDLRMGEQIYKEICFACHGLKGDGKGPGWVNTKPSPQVFINAVYMSRLTDRYMFNVVKYGKLAVLNRQIPDNTLESLAMPAFGAVLEDDQIRELMKFERAFSEGGTQSAEMREIFDAACAVCHGKGGRGDGERASPVQPAPKYFVSDAQPSPMNLTDRQLMARFSDEFIFSGCPRECHHHDDQPRKFSPWLGFCGAFRKDRLIDSGETKSITLVFEKAGKLEFYCPQPGHCGKGMAGSVTITQN